MHEITFITTHPKKAEQLSWHLNYPVRHYKLEIPEIQSLDPHAVVTAKAQGAYNKLRCPILVEDYSLCFLALGKLPGPLIKWFLSELEPEGLCRILDFSPNRKAVAQTSFAFCDKGNTHIFDGVIQGTIAQHPRGSPGYGADATFIPDGHTKTWGEMDEDEQLKTSVRRIGLKKLEAYLRSILDSNWK